MMMAMIRSARLTVAVRWCHAVQVLKVLGRLLPAIGGDDDSSTLGSCNDSSQDSDLAVARDEDGQIVVHAPLFLTERKGGAMPRSPEVACAGNGDGWSRAVRCQKLFLKSTPSWLLCCGSAWRLASIELTLLLYSL